MGRRREALRRETGLGANHKRIGLAKRIRSKNLDDAHGQKSSPPKRQGV
jgi:hypothetical protein